MKVAQSVTDLIGNTPLLQLKRVVDDSMAEVWVKLEKFNPGGSVKDRPALRMIEAAEQDGTLHPGMTLIEPTSGNTGIGIAMVAAAKGYRAILVMPDTMTWERIAILKGYGAQVVLTPGSLRMSGAVQKAKELKDQLGEEAILLLQFENPNNPDAHRNTTALEILEQTDHQLDAFIASSGTGGTITGCGEVLKDQLPQVKIYVVEPKGSPVLSGGEAGSHKIVGTSPGFIPKVLNTTVYDRIFQVSDDDALEMTKRLAREEALLVGVSSGAVVHTALQVAKELGVDKRVVALCADTGERYLSMDLF